jgi:hypothetical protein
LNGGPREKDYDRVVMWVGADGLGILKAFGGFQNKGGVSIQAGKGPASITVFDTAGKAITDLAKRE